MNRKTTNNPKGAGRKQTNIFTNEEINYIISNYKYKSITEITNKIHGKNYFAVRRKIVELQTKGLINKKHLIQIRGGKVLPSQGVNFDNLHLAYAYAQEYFNKEMKQFIKECQKAIKKQQT